MSAVWYTSDTHWGHKLVSGLRGFDTPQEHDEALYQNWVDTVEVEDTVYLLGDISVGGKGNEMYALSLLSTLPGRKILIA